LETLQMFIDPAGPGTMYLSRSCTLRILVFIPFGRACA